MDQNLFAVLSSKYSESEALAIESLIQNIEELRQRSDALTADEWQKGLALLGPARLRSSGTLKSGKLSGWIAANSYVSPKVIEEKCPTEAEITYLNRLITENPHSSIRKADIYIGPNRACGPEHLPDFLNHFYENILPSEKHGHPLVAAALARYWLVSLHPYEDGNGRTSVMLCDWLLLSKNYLPLSFERQLDAVIGIFQKGRVSATPGQATIKTLKSVLHSYQLVLELSLSRS